ncbi:5-(carboxyamino)imidazole ribonucleotide synthase [Thermodesulfatator autotrophicus]|uniref:N5-carboxyaminoimidazole ribonucleotide synthase n=1 Tax=Thermodesulfatator autotrophicus TaxID=1795632 RepID=A0A177E8F0_9BACT|nr:5-(carboxyamino)imidazole ribonucleotide synthase [Thermodesulfatator autotrophicus]
MARLGILGGGQLGKMMAQKAKKMGFYVTVLDPTPEAPAAQVSDKQIIGDFHDAEKIRELVEQSDVTTYDLEHVNTKALKRLLKEGHRIYPSPDLLETIQDKFKQKEMLARLGAPLPKFRKVKTTEELSSFGFPVVQKACKGGYDGRGVVVLKSQEDVEKALPGETYIEEFVEFEKELAVIVARGINGERKVYPVVEMVFDERANICDLVIAPARIDKNLAEEAQKIAINIAEKLEIVGVLAVEMFLTKDKRVLVNELAPRPHNSGHYTIEACATCQFEQHVRAIAGLPLGSTKLLSPAVMINLLGEEGFEGPPLIEGLEEALSISGLSFHFYGKKITKPFRKMGHVTIVDDDLEKAIETVEKVKKFLKIKAEGKA